MMKRRMLWVLSVLTLALTLVFGTVHPWSPGWDQPATARVGHLASGDFGELGAEVEAEDSPPPELFDETFEQSFDDIVSNADVLPGLFTLYRDRDTDQIYLELTPHQLNRNFISIATLNSGLGEFLYRGLPLGEFLFQFRKVRDSIQVVVPNIYFRTDGDDPQQRSVERSFSNSTIASLPILSTHPQRETYLIDWTEVLMGGQELSGFISTIGLLLGGYVPNPNTSYLDTVKAFPNNVEIDAVYGFTGGGFGDGLFSLFELSTLPDARAFDLSVHFSLSQLPTNNGYQPRVADERLGYFITAYQNLSQVNQNDLFVRYINRWHLEKANPDAPLSPPKEPIVFWIENTVPLAYREAIREGILVWNQAFETAGFQNAIEARQMPDDADWDPADVRYNTIRWTNSLDFFAALGIHRTNPLTGQILDADVIIDATIVRLIQNGEGFLASQLQQQGLALNHAPSVCNQTLQRPYLQWLALQQTGQLSREAIAPNPNPPYSIPSTRSPLNPLTSDSDYCFGLDIANNAAMGALALTTLDNNLPSGEVMQAFTHQYLFYLTAHEVGHALGLRHNFRGSTLLSPDELNDVDLTRERGLTASVMDYTPVNLAPMGSEQGDFFSTTVGPYDKWVIEYGYRPSGAVTPIQERQMLEAIARRAPEDGLSYAPDEDAFDFYNPEAVRWDMSSDPLQYSQWQMDTAQQLWDKLHFRYPIAGESYSELRDRFDLVFFYYFNHALTATRYIGGQVFNRDRRGDPGGRLPFELVPLEQQRHALQVIQHYVFDEDAFDFSPTLINQLAPSRWLHWGSFPTVSRLDYPIYETVSFLQSIVLTDLLSSERLVRLRDAALSYGQNEVLSLPELLDTVQRGVWSELLRDTDHLTTIPSLRRSLQRQHVDILSLILLGSGDALNDPAISFTDFIAALQTIEAPEDARVLARYQLRVLGDRIRTVLRQQDDLDLLTRAHLEDTGDRIAKVLNAQL
ncbi:MAG: zinc-dependent metalloprotease [Leptolyngbyaceae bacterium]|nr:zinc-dependent metalloprotease [Leptolyngbyaceae bacterium]